MKNAIILHGGPSKKEYYNPITPSESNKHWIPWLQAQLLKNDIACVTPEVPNSYDRHWPTWKKEVERYDFKPDTILVGHSTGAGFFVKYLSINHDIKVGKVFLVAPWLDPYQEHTKDFFDDFEVNPNLLKQTNGITIFNSDNDQESVQKTVQILRQTINGIVYHGFHNYGHFCYEDMKTDKFPELLSAIII